MSDNDGWKRGAKGGDGNNEGQYEGRGDFKMPKLRCEFGEESDYGAEAVSHRLANLVEDGAGYGDLGNSLRNEYWQARPIKPVETMLLRSLRAITIPTQSKLKARPVSSASLVAVASVQVLKFE